MSNVAGNRDPGLIGVNTYLSAASEEPEKNIMTLVFVVHVL